MSAAGCLAEEELAPDTEEGSSVTQEVDRGWWALIRSSPGDSFNPNAGGLLMQLSLAGRNVSGYVQTWSTSPPVSYVIGRLKANCSYGPGTLVEWGATLTLSGDGRSTFNLTSCPPGTTITNGGFWLHVDN